MEKYFQYVNTIFSEYKFSNMRFIFLFSVLFCICHSSISQWNEVPLPSVNPNNRIISIGDNLFTHMSPGGVFKSIDGGTNWERKITGLPPTMGYSDLISYNENLYVATYSEGVYLSKNEGESWDKVDNIPNRSYAYFTLHNDKIYIISYDDFIYMSDETGENWNQINNPESLNHSSGSDQTFIFSSGTGNLMVYAENQLFHSANSGNSWNTTALDSTLGTISLLKNRISSNGNSIWVTALSSNFGPILFYSLDNSLTWNFIEIESNYYPDSIEINSDYVAYTLLNSINVSNDNGVSWNTFYHTSAEQILYSNETGLYLTSNNTASIFNPNTQEFSEFKYSGIKNHHFNKVLDMGENLVLHSKSSLKSLGFLNKENNVLRPILPRSNGSNYLYDVALFKNEIYGVFDGEIYKLLLDSEVWTPSFQHPYEGYLWTLGKTENSLYAGEETRVFYSDESNTFKDAGVEVTLNGVLNVLENDTLKIIATQQLNISHNGSVWKTSDPDTYQADYVGIELINSKIFTSTINGFYWTDTIGATWNEIESSQFGSVHIIKHHDNRIYIGTDNGIFMSMDEGSNWISKNENLNNFIVTDILFDIENIYLSTIGAGLWTKPIHKLYTAPTIESVIETVEVLKGESIQIKINSLKITDDDSLFPDDFELIITEGVGYSVSSNGEIVLKDQELDSILINVQVTDGYNMSNIYAINVSIVEELTKPDAEKFSLFPNPSTSKVKLEVDEEGPYEILVFNLAGNLVKKTIDIPNNNLLELEIDELSSGNYIIKVTFNNEVSTYRLIKK